jgi:hypothetical protein
MNRAIYTPIKYIKHAFYHPADELQFRQKKARKISKRKVKQALTNRMEHVAATVNGKESLGDR